MVSKDHFIHTKSEFLKVNGFDFLIALYHGFFVCIVPVIGYFNAERLPTNSEWWVIIAAILSAFLGSLLKSALTNSEGQVFKEENGKVSLAD